MSQRCGAVGCAVAVTAFGIQSAGLCRHAGVGEPLARTRVPLPRDPSQGDVCTEMVALRVPGAASGAELEMGTLSFFPSFMHPLTVKRAGKSNSSTQIRVWGFFPFNAPHFGASFAILGLV